MYVLIESKCKLPQRAGGSDIIQNDYFEEKNTYWEPASTVDDLYEQLSHHKYREISRQHIE